MAECSDRCRVGRHGVIGEIASDNLRQPAPLLGDRLVHPVSHLLLDLLELTPHAVTPGFPLEEELAMTGTSANVGEAQEIEGLRFAKPAPVVPVRRMATELDQASLRWSDSANSSNRLRIASQKRRASTSCAKQTT